MNNLVSSYYEKEYDILDLNTDVYLISKEIYNEDIGRRAVISIIDNEEGQLFIKKSFVDCIKYYDDSVIKHILEYSMDDEDVEKTLKDINENPKKYETNNVLYKELESHCYGELINSCILDIDENSDEDFMDSEDVLEAIRSIDEVVRLKDYFQ